MIGESFAASYPREGVLKPDAFVEGVVPLVVSCVLGSIALAPFQAAATFARPDRDSSTR